MNTKEQFIAFLEENSINFEEVNDKILFEFDNHYLVAKGFWKKGFRVGMPFAFATDGELTNSDKELVRLCVQGEKQGVFFEESVVLYPDNSLKSDEIFMVSDNLSNKALDIDEIKQQSVELISAFWGAFIGIKKLDFSISPTVLRRIEDTYDKVERFIMNNL